MSGKKCPTKHIFVRQNILSDKAYSCRQNTILSTKPPARKFRQEMSNKAISCRTFSCRNFLADKNMLLSVKKSDKSIFLSTKNRFVGNSNVRQKHFLVGHFLAGRNVRQKYACRTKCPTKHFLVDKKSLLSDKSSGKTRFSCRQSAGKKKVLPTKICFCRTKCPTKAFSCRQKYAFVGKNVRQSIFLLADIFCWRGGQLFSYTMGGDLKKH